MLADESFHTIYDVVAMSARQYPRNIFLSKSGYEAHFSFNSSIIYLLERLTGLGCNRLTAFYMDQPQKNGSVPGRPNCEMRAANLIGR